jgi:hypothetical protein
MLLEMQKWSPELSKKDAYYEMGEL